MTEGKVESASQLLAGGMAPKNVAHTLGVPVLTPLSPASRRRAPSCMRHPLHEDRVAGSSHHWIARFKTATVVVAALALLAGCASYHPRPLSEVRAPQALSPLEKEGLVKDAATLSHPRLPPVKVDFSKPLTGRELGVVAVLVNPDLKALRAQEQVAVAQVFAAGLLPDPELAASLAFPTSKEPGLVNGYSIGVNWLIAALVTRPKDVQIAQAAAAQLHWDVAWTEWLVANQARLLAQRIMYLVQRQAVAEQAARSEKQVLDTLRQRVAEHAVTEEALGLHLSGYMKAQGLAFALSREAESARQELNRVLGIPPDERLPLATAPAARPPREDSKDLFTQAERERLDLIALRAGYASQEARVYRAVLGQYPRVTLGLVTARDPEAVRTRGVSVSLDVPLLNRNRGAIAVTDATREQLYQEYISRLHQTRADIAALVAELTLIEQERSALDAQLPALIQSERRLAAGLARGYVSVLSYVTVRTAVLDQQLQSLSLAQAAAEREVALDIAVGTPWTL